MTEYTIRVRRLEYQWEPNGEGRVITFDYAWSWTGHARELAAWLAHNGIKVPDLSGTTGETYLVGDSYRIGSTWIDVAAHNVDMPERLWLAVVRAVVKGASEQ